MKKRALALFAALTMTVGMSMSAAAAPEAPREFPGQGYLSESETDGPGGMIDVSIPEDGFFWFANEDTEQNGNTGTYDIKSAVYQIENNSDRVNLEVSLVSYAQKSGGLNELASYEDDITLNLEFKTAGSAIDAGTAIGQDIFNSGNGYKGTYSEIMTKGAVWSYSFNGEYTGVLPSAGAVSDYVFVLQFEAVSID